MPDFGVAAIGTGLTGIAPMFAFDLSKGRLCDHMDRCSVAKEHAGIAICTKCGGTPVNA
jgi:hypothetical protein